MMNSRLGGLAVFTLTVIGLAASGREASAASCFRYSGLLYIYVEEGDEVTWIEKNYYDSRATDVWVFSNRGDGYRWHKIGTWNGITFVQVFGTDNDDVITCHRLNRDAHCSIYGEGGNDSLYGSSGGDFIHGGGGHDTISGGSGDDWMIGDDGDDRLYGNWGRDTLIGGAGYDYLDGGDDDSDDHLTGGSQLDVFRNYMEYGFLSHYQDTADDYDPCCDYISREW